MPRYNFSRGDLLRKVDFDIKGDDLIVFLHIQAREAPLAGRPPGAQHPAGAWPCECWVRRNALAIGLVAGDVALLQVLHGLELRTARCRLASSPAACPPWWTAAQRQAETVR